jgi:hypothetical protein
VPGQAARAELRELAERRHRDPERVIALVRERPAAEDPVDAAMAAWVEGLALHEIGLAHDAVARYRVAIDGCHRRDDPDSREIGALAAAGMAISLLGSGRTDDAVEAMDEARRSAPASAKAVVEMLYGLLLQRTGRLSDALRSYRRAERGLERRNDRATLARLQINRSTVLAYRGDLAAALTDLSECEAIALALDLPVLAAMAAHNTGFVQGRRGDLPGALAAFDRAEQAYARLERPDRFVCVLETDRCEILLMAGLTGEARAAAETAVAAVAATGDQIDLAESRLLLTRALLAGADYDEARAEAADVVAAFGGAGRAAWAAQARYLEVQAAVLAAQDGRPPPRLLGQCRQLATELDRHGWRIEAVHVRTFVGRLALGLGRPAVARAELAGAAAARRRGPAELRAQAWHAAALLHLAEGDRPGARRSLTAGLAVVDRYRASLGATELRTGVAGHGAELARLGTRLALEDASPAAVLRWAERWRSGALRRPSVQPPDDDRLAQALADLRAAESDAREAALAGEVPEAVTRRAQVLEEEVRKTTRLARDDTAVLDGRVDTAALRRALDGRVLVEYIELDGALWAISSRRSRLALHALGPSAVAEGERDYLRFGLRRQLASRSVGDREATVSATAARLGEALLGPIDLPPDTEVIVVPTGGLHGVAWGALPDLTGRPTTIAPSATIWLGDGTAPHRRRRRRVVLVAGPGLPGAEREVDLLRESYPDAEVLTGADAHAARVLAALESADLVHLAAHGRFRADSPLFSSVQLADGPLTVYDLERLRAAPTTVVLSACDAGTVAVRSGDELLGTATALLHLGVTSVVAPVMAVPDDATTPLMVALHERLAANARPAVALAEAALAVPGVAAAAFVCIGRDDRSLSAR